MKILFSILLILWALTATINFAQQIHTVLVPDDRDIELQAALDEFYDLHLNHSQLLDDADHGNAWIQNHLGFGGNWPNAMLLWRVNNVPLLTSLTACAVIAYANASVYERKPRLREKYIDLAMQGAEFLLCSQLQHGNDGGFTQLLSSSTVNEVFGTSHAGAALVEAYLVFGDRKYYDAAIRAAEWQLTHATYPSNNYPDPRDPWKYFSNANHMGQQLWHLSKVYEITGNVKYLNRCIQIAEELIAWQDYIDQREFSTIHPVGWLVAYPGSLPDGSWYYYNYDPLGPLPPGVPVKPGGNYTGSYHKARKQCYHLLTLHGLLELFKVTAQHTGEGITTLRNQEPFSVFRQNLFATIIKATNYLIDNQETAASNGETVYGLLKAYKNYNGDGISWDGQTRTFSIDNKSEPGGLQEIAETAEILTNGHYRLSEEDKNEIQKFKLGVANNLFGIRNIWQFWEWQQFVGDRIMPGWSKYISQLVTPFTITELKNTGFEDKKIKWELFSWDTNTVTVKILEENGHTGMKALHLRDGSTNASGWASQIVKSQPNIDWEFSAFAHILSGNQQIYLDFLDENLDRIACDWRAVYENNNYERVSISGTAPEGTAFVRVWIYADWYTTNDGYWDDAELAFKEKKGDCTTQERSTTMTCNPNPFNPVTTIRYEIPKSGRVTLAVYNLLGERIAVLADEEKEAGAYQVPFDGSKLSSGVYIYKLTTGENMISRKMTLVK